MKGRSRKGKGKRLAASSIKQSPRPRAPPGTRLLSPTVAQALWYTVYALLSIVVGTAAAICTQYGAEIGQAIFGGSMAVTAVVSTISQLVLALLLAALTVTGRMLGVNCWALWYKMYAVGSGVLASAVAVCSHYGPKVGQGVVGGLTAVSGVPFVLFLCVLSMMLAAATVIGWRLRMNCWGFVWTASRLLRSTCCRHRICARVKHLPPIHLDKVVGVSVYALGFILVGSAVAICNLCGVEIGQGTTGILVDIGVVSSAMSMLVLPLLLAAVIATSWMLCMYRWVSWVIMYVLGFILAGSAMVICTHRGSAIGQAILGGFMALGLAPSAFSGGVLSMLLVACAVTGGMLCTNYQSFVETASRLWRTACRRAECGPHDNLPTTHLHKEGQSVGVEGPGDIENDVKSSQSKTDTKTTSDQHSEQHQDDDDDDDAGRTRDVKHIPNAQQLNPESVPSCSGQADSLPTTTAPAQEEHGDSVPAELPSGTAEPAEQPCASSNDNNPQGMTKSQRRREKKKQAASQAKDAQASNKSTSKGPQTPPEQSPTRAKVSPAQSPDSAMVDQAADKPSVDVGQVQTGEWVQDRASKRKAQQAKRGLPSNTGTQARNTKNASNKAGNSSSKSVSTKKKAFPNSLPRQAVRSSTVLPQMQAPDTVTGNSHPKPNSGKTYSSAIGQTMGVGTDVVVPLVGHKAPIKGLEQLDKLPCGASAFTAFRSVRGDGDCAFRAIVVAMLEQAFLGTMQMRMALLSNLTFWYILMPLAHRTPDVELGHKTFMGLLQTMNEGKSKLHLNEILQSAFKETTCNAMVSLLRAITADGFCKHPHRWLEALRLSTECDSVDMDFLCDVFVRPLACKHRDDMWQQRWPDHPHLQVLAECLGLNFRVHNTQNKYYVTGFGECADHNRVFHLLHTGCHYQLMYK